MSSPHQERQPKVWVFNWRHSNQVGWSCCCSVLNGRVELWSLHPIRDWKINAKCWYFRYFSLRKKMEDCLPLRQVDFGEKEGLHSPEAGGLWRKGRITCSWDGWTLVVKEGLHAPEAAEPWRKGRITCPPRKLDFWEKEGLHAPQDSWTLEKRKDYMPPRQVNLGKKGKITCPWDSWTLNKRKDYLLLREKEGLPAREAAGPWRKGRITGSWWQLDLGEKMATCTELIPTMDMESRESSLPCYLTLSWEGEEMDCNFCIRT